MPAFKDWFKDSQFYYFLNVYRAARWQMSGSPVPAAPLIKQRVLQSYGTRFGLTTLVETGTALGDTIYALKNSFTEIYSIELSPTLYQQAQKRLAAYGHIHLKQGNSAEILPQIVSGLTSPALFWLDAHYSAGPTARADKDTPILEEVSTILSPDSPAHVLLVDDARNFDGTNDYPRLEEFQEYMQRIRPGWEFYVEHDIIRIHPKIAGSP